jgi:hypothetical protein
VASFSDRPIKGNSGGKWEVAPFDRADALIAVAVAVNALTAISRSGRRERMRPITIASSSSSSSSSGNRVLREFAGDSGLDRAQSALNDRLITVRERSGCPFSGNPLIGRRPRHRSPPSNKAARRRLVCHSFVASTTSSVPQHL